ncbi:hypothetical protein PRUB_b0132 [Pseudoalteromonas rubra]|uniref:Uncharacterized protein n=1 Tax=Pseudoalteromonas rubra TaxID=43658 RepID=A0A8T0BYP1_9GAMM|nr:hypothetical protein PRUB_b0132 [Pseudoalteromonas rubra]
MNPDCCWLDKCFLVSNLSCGVTISMTATGKEAVSDAFDKFEQVRNEATHQAGRYDA